MEEESTAPDGALGYLQQNSGEFIKQVEQYSYLLVDALYFIAMGVVVIFIIQRLAIRFVYPRFSDTRLLTLTFFTLYLLVLVTTVILLLGKLGFDMSVTGSLAILVVIILAIVLYFVIPFLPKLPFLPGHMIVAYGEMGTVEAISTFHTTIRKFDGTLVFIPNAMIMASKLLNYSYLPNRRIEMAITVTPDSDLAVAKERLLELANLDSRVLAEPPPAVFVMGADASGIRLTLFCWVENADFLGTQSDLWSGLMGIAADGQGIELAIPRQAVRVDKD